MSIDWGMSDLTFLKNRLKQGNVSLFAGAGFSWGAFNATGERLPLGNKLAELLADKASMPYDGDPLPHVYEAVTPRIGGNELWRYLHELYTVETEEPWYRIVRSITWHRIYTTNIDNLFQRESKYPSGQTLRTIVRGDPAEERSIHFEQLQCIHLHGHINYKSNGLTFSVPDFASHTAQHDPWYLNLVDDLTFRPMLFIGSQMDEPMLWHYLQLRDSRSKGERETRPKSYLVSPSLSPIRMQSLQSRNIVGIKADSEEFFASLESNVDLGSLEMKSVQSIVWPHLYPTSGSLARGITNHFDPIHSDELPPTKVRESRFFLGAEPTWDDIGKCRDAVRDVRCTLLEKAVSHDAFQLLVLQGPPGCGKSTSLMRVACDLAEQGHTVFFARGEYAIDFADIIKLAERHDDADRRFVICVDIVASHVSSISRVRNQLRELDHVTLIVAERTKSQSAVLARLQGKRVVDVGCGYTPYARDSMFRACHDAGIEFYGVDPLIGTDIKFGFRERAVARATGSSGHFSKRAPGLANALCASAEELPFEDESVDEILSSYLLFVWIEDQELLADILGEFLRVIKPGGSVKLYPLYEWRFMRIRSKRLRDVLARFSIRQSFVHGGRDFRVTPSMLTELTRL